MPQARLLPAPDPAWAYFLDIDGTLLDLARSPDAVRVTPEMRDLLAMLHVMTGGAVALISGRSMRDIDALFPGIALQAAAQHGLERRDVRGTHPWGGPSMLDASTARSRLETLVARHRALLLEDKGHSLALHYRAAPALERVVYETVYSVREELGDDFLVQRGKYVVELRPSGIDKGDAIAAFMDEAPFVGRLPVFVGDDVTDEHGFAVVNEMDGLSVKVGSGETLAQWRLPDARAVERWLGRMRTGR